MGKRGPKTERHLGELRQVTLMLDELSVARLRALGDGNLSLGTREAARFAYNAYQADEFTPDKKTETSGG